MPRGIHGSRDIKDETIQSVDIKDGTITNADISPLANIDQSKISQSNGWITEISSSGGNSTNYKVNITPTYDSNGYLGEYYVTNKLANSFDVVKSGSASGTTFDWILAPGI